MDCVLAIHPIKAGMVRNVFICLSFCRPIHTVGIVKCTNQSSHILHNLGERNQAPRCSLMNSCSPQLEWGI